MTLLKLRDLGHPDYMKKEEIISCSTELELAESMVTTYKTTVFLKCIICFFWTLMLGF